MFRKFSHAFVAVILHTAILLAAHRIAVEVIELVRDEFIVTFSEKAIALAWGL